MRGSSRGRCSLPIHVSSSFCFLDMRGQQKSAADKTALLATLCHIMSPGDRVPGVYRRFVDGLANRFGCVKDDAPDDAAMSRMLLLPIQDTKNVVHELFGGLDLLLAAFWIVGFEFNEYDVVSLLPFDKENGVTRLVVSPSPGKTKHRRVSVVVGLPFFQQQDKCIRVKMSRCWIVTFLSLASAPGSLRTTAW